MSELEPLHREDASPEARETMDAAEEAMGFVPNLIGVMAHAPATAEAYLTLNGLLGETSLEPVEQQIVLAATSFENGCEYCMAAHSGGLRQAGASDDLVEAVRSGEPLPDPRHDALFRFTRSVVRERGWVSDGTVRSFRDAGFEKHQVLEVVLGVAMKTLSNYTNHIADTPLDDELTAFAWSKPEGVAAE